MGMNFDDEGVENQRRLGAAWLRPLLRETFWWPCPAHPELPRNECNYFCIDCAARSICWLCLSDHRGHHVLQIRRSSYHNVIRVRELEMVADISLVQTYALNADRVVFLNPRPQAPRHAIKCVGAAGACATCGRGLVDATFRFCSVACKLGRVASDPNLTLAVDPKRRREPDDDDDMPRPNKFQRPGQISYRQRSRKGIPRRAPLV